VSTYSLFHLPDHMLLRDLAALVTQDRATTAALLAHLAEVDARKLYLPAAYPSMFAWCVGELRMSEDVACRRIHAARTARRFPAIFADVAEGRLHLSAVVLLASYLTPETADELLTAARHKTKAEVERFLAERFPQSELPTRQRALSPATSPNNYGNSLAPGQVGLAAPERGVELSLAATGVNNENLGVRKDEQSAPARMEMRIPPARVAPLAPERFALQVTIKRSTHDNLRYAQELLGHQIPSGDVAEVLDRALELLVRNLEKRKFAATSRPHAVRQRPSAGERYVPAHVRRTVWERDRGRCTFVSEAGHRCEARSRLEFDHIEPVARGGRATVEGMRLRCRAHNQYGAEQVFGSEFMGHKRRMR
jgi:hypothetical protein